MRSRRRRPLWVVVQDEPAVGHYAGVDHDGHVTGADQGDGAGDPVLGVSVGKDVNGCVTALSCPVSYRHRPSRDGRAADLGEGARNGPWFV